VNDEQRVRLDQYLAEKFPEWSRSLLQKFIDQGRCTVNGLVVRRSKKLVAPSDEIILHLPTPPNFSGRTLPVIYSDENVLVINKPAGILTHSKGNLTDEFTVADFVASQMSTADLASFSPTNNRPGIVHRLDRATSGVLIAAKNLPAHRLLQKQFAARTAHKTYLAIVEKAPKLDAARIDLPIERNPKAPAEFRVGAAGKPASTDYRILEKLPVGGALVELKPATGRTHQLRVHLTHIGAPIVGDSLYGGGRDGDRMFLHAARLEITIPAEPNNQRRIFTAPLPDDFLAEIKRRDGRFDFKKWLGKND
jgi:23S rRNA pseudouridine1911/1915/1917 synthase